MLLTERRALAEVVRVGIAVRPVQDANLGLCVRRMRRKRVQRIDHGRRRAVRRALDARFRLAKDRHGVGLAHSVYRADNVVLGE